MPRKTRREEHTEATRRALLLCAREIFTDIGYQAASIDAISKAARVTKGAFYHHFEDKSSLFDAVVVQMQSEAADAIRKQAISQQRIWDRLGAGINAYLDICLDQGYRRIVLQEAPVILGQARYLEIDEAYPLKLLIDTLKALKYDGELFFEDVYLLSHLVEAMVSKIAAMQTQSSAANQLRDNGQAAIDAFLEIYRRK